MNVMVWFQLCFWNSLLQRTSSKLIMIIKLYISEQYQIQMAKIKILVVGAGPVGLAAALFLSSVSDAQIDIIDQLTSPKVISESKALSINPRTMQILNGSKTQTVIKEKAMKINKFKIGTPQKIMTQNDVKDLLIKKTKFPHLYIYPQHLTENLLEEEIKGKGIKVRRGVTFESIIKNDQKKVHVKLSDQKEEAVYDIVLAADGAHSSVRRSLKLNMMGETLPQKIYIADYEVQGKRIESLEVRMGNPEIFIMIPVTDNVVRFMGNFPDLISFAEKNCQVKSGKKMWESSFSLNNRTIEKMRVGNVYFAGDSAHVHAPIGGRGMNLGIEDVFIFSELLKNNKLKDYNSIRMPVVRDFVNRMKNGSKHLDYKKSIIRSALPYLGSALNLMVKDSMIEFATGIDRNIPFLPRL